MWRLNVGATGQFALYVSADGNLRG
jgi:hypothetical protein